MRNEEEVLALITDYAEKNEFIRAAVLTGSRASPERHSDWLSDYDIDLYVSDVTPFLQSDDWLDAFGPIMVRWPRCPEPTFSPGWITRLVLFGDRTRIDFQITASKEAEVGIYNNARRILVDKDNIAVSLPFPAHTARVVTQPSEKEYEDTVNAFWWDAPYVPKALWRDELPFARYMLDESLRFKFLHRVIDWKIGHESDWSVNPGTGGKHYQRLLDGDTWRAYESTYAGSDRGAIWQAFFNLVNLFSNNAQALANRLDFPYPLETEQDVRQYCIDIYSDWQTKGKPVR